MTDTGKEYTAVVTVVGRDKPGIISAVTGVLANCNVNIINISQTIIQDIFQMIMLIDSSQATVSFRDLGDDLTEKGREISCQIILQQRDVFTAMHRI